MIVPCFRQALHEHDVSMVTLANQCMMAVCMAMQAGVRASMQASCALFVLTALTCVDRLTVSTVYAWQGAEYAP